MSYTSPLDRLSPIARRYLQDARHLPVHPHSIRRHETTIQSRTMNVTPAELIFFFLITGVLIAVLIWLCLVTAQYTMSWIWSYQDRQTSREHHRDRYGDEVSSCDEVAYREQDVTITQTTQNVSDIREHDVTISRRKPRLLERIAYVFKQPADSHRSTQRDCQDHNISIRTPSIWDQMGSVFRGPSRDSITAAREGERQLLIAKHAVGKRVGYFEGINSYNEAVREAGAYADGMYENPRRTPAAHQEEYRERRRVVSEIPDRQVAFLEENHRETIRDQGRLEYVVV